MAQKRVTEYFQNRKRAEIQYDLHPSKRAKLEPRKLRSKQVDIEVELGKTEEKTVAISTACLDDHNNILPSTPTKRSLRSGHSPSTKKRSRVVDTPDLSEGFKTPDKGYDFSVFVSGDKTSGTTSARRRLLRKKLEPQDSTLNMKPETQKSATVAAVKNADISNDNKPEKLEDTVEVMKKNLAGCTSLAQLREALAQANKSKAKLKQLAAEPKGKSISKEEMKQREVLGKFEVDKDMLKKRLAECDEAKSKLNQIMASVSTVQSEQRDITSEKSSEVKVPAHDRFHALAAKVPPSLILPVSYGVLLEMFNCTEIIISRLHNRSETCTFNKLKMGVEQMTKKRFDEKHLGQIKTVFPTAYHFRQEKDLPTGTGGKISDYQLTVDAVLDDFTLSKPGDTVKNKLSEDGHKLTPVKLVERRSRFHQNLISIVKRYHAEFLSTLKTPLKVADDKLTRWHALFEVDKVPEIEVAPLPQKSNERKIYSAQEALEFVRNKCDKRVLRALEVVASKSCSSSTTTVPIKPNSPNSKVPPPGPGGIKSQVVTNAVKGIDPELLARIRAKEALKATQQMTRTPEEQQRLERLQRLPQFVRILKCYFDGQKRPATPVNDVVSTFVDSYKTSISPVEAEQHLRLLSETVPEWVSLVRTSRGEYVKVDRNLDVNMIASKVQKVADNF